MGGLISAADSPRRANNIYAEATANNRIAEYQGDAYDAAARDSRFRGQQEAQRALLKGSQVEGQARTAIATSGVDSQSGSALEALRDTRMFSSLDAQTAINNAAREAWGYEVRGANARAQGQVGLAKAANQAQDVMLSGYAQGASSVLSLGLAG